MRIIGGHDYYDCGLAHGQDDAILFMRNGDRRLSDDDTLQLLRFPRVICSGYLLPAGEEEPRYVRQSRTLSDRHAFHQIEIGRKVRHAFHTAHVVLCGRMHNGLLVIASEPYGVPREIESRWVWSVEALRAYAADHCLDVHEGRSGATQSWEWDGSRRYQADVEVQDLNLWFAPQALPDAARNRLLDERITILSRDPSDHIPPDADRVHRPWRVDQPCLGQMHFAKAVDPYTAFQEISMWIGGVLPQPGPGMVEITDNKVKIQKHGFDPTSSFRRAPSGDRK